MYKDIIIYLLNGIEDKKDLEVFTKVIYKCIINNKISLEEFQEIMEKLINVDNGGVKNENC